MVFSALFSDTLHYRTLLKVVSQMSCIRYIGTKRKNNNKVTADALLPIDIETQDKAILKTTEETNLLFPAPFQSRFATLS